MSTDCLLRKSSSSYSLKGQEKVEDEVVTGTPPPYRADSYYSKFNHADRIRKSSSQYFTASKNQIDNEQFWKSIIGGAVYFKGHDPLFGNVIAAVYQSPRSKKLNSVVISRHGQSVIMDINISKNSVYYPAINNLRTKEAKKSRVRKCLAVSLLKAYSAIDRNVVDSMLHHADLPIQFDWDETMAGDLASRMQLINTKSPTDIGDYLLSLGYFRDCQRTETHMIDVVYQNPIAKADDQLIDKNNMLAYLLGEQIEHLFDPLLEYSPEPTEKGYTAPETPPELTKHVGGDDDFLVKSICIELVNFQTNFTVSLVQFLQKFLVPMRVHILKGEIKGYTTGRLNQIFPPTIDEVTRINCIFLDMLKLSQPYGSFELLKACGTTIPYFYKACMRHEAATKRFTEEYEQFVADLRQLGKEDLLTYDGKTIQGIMTSSSLNLVKIQLILQRLMDAKKWNKCSYDENGEIEKLFHSCNDTIVSFANDKLKPYSHRIFTPTGKILTELASSWPTELQYGWLNRRVVAIFDAEDMLIDGVKNRGALIIFSDHILLLEIDDEEYYYELWSANKKLDSSSKEHVHRPSISDVLMHSLINEVPVNGLPHIKVKNWCRIDEVTATHYDYGNDSYVRLFNKNFVGQYRVNKYSGKYFVDIIRKAQILNKSQAFHLFRNVVDNNTLYYTAHEFNSYVSEDVKSPMLVLFNTQFNPAILTKYSIFGFITLNFSKSETILMEGMSATAPKFQHIVRVQQLTEALAQKVIQLLADYTTLSNPILRDEIISDTEIVVADAIRFLERTDRMDENEHMDIIHRVKNVKRESTVTEELRMTNSRSSTLDVLMNNEGKRTSSTRISKKNQIKRRRSARRSFIEKIFGKRKMISQPEAHSIDRTTISRPMTIKMAPEKVRSAAGIAAPKKEISPSDADIGVESSEVKDYKTGEETVATASASASLYVNSHFEFPVESGVETALEAKTTDKQTVKVLRPPSIIQNNEAHRGIPQRVPAIPSAVTTASPKLEVASVCLAAAPAHKGVSDFKTPCTRIHRVSSSTQIYRQLRDENFPKLGLSPHRNQIPMKLKKPPPTRPDRDSQGKAANLEMQSLYPNEDENKEHVHRPPVKQIDALQRSESYYDKFKLARGMQEQTVKSEGIALVSDVKPSVLTQSSIIYSPSVRAKLTSLANNDRRVDGDNWTCFTSRENTKPNLAVETIPEEQFSETMDDEEKRFDDSLKDGHSSTVRPFEANNSSSGDNATLKSSPQWTEIGVNTILDGNESQASRSDDHTLASVSIDLVKDIEGYVFDSESFFDETDDKKESDSADETSMCSALEDLKDTSQAGIIVQLADGKLLPSDSTTSICDLIGDDSYDYLGHILAGEIAIGDETICGTKISEVNETIDSDYNRAYSESLRESSFQYLARYFGSRGSFIGETNGSFRGESSETAL
ncbi:hypothetical protein FOA43_003318 [Brettanomyces nanus]|uniref:Uncharacterized protein n=1 Tax=Eeniella nana TaxID=13502 RepID=A0A875S7M5_EENNA|nr:uncharacterized protein FOA43_003318 [Brettanomyces nanus]QPG75932.1 hypothetical protein FOA43_003318 [Brettanomyces nanus]